MAPAMALDHPFDRELREKLRARGPNQAEFARAIGRSQGWLNKYMHGVGNATIDDAIRIAAHLTNGSEAGLSDSERRLLRAWRQIPEQSRDDAVLVFENFARARRLALHRGQGAPKAQKLPATSRRARATP